MARRKKRITVKHKNHWMSRKQAGYLMGLERDTGHQVFIQRSEGGMTKQAASLRIRDLVARTGDGDDSDLDASLHHASCTGCAMDRLTARGL